MTKFIILRQVIRRISVGGTGPDQIISTTQMEEVNSIDEALASIQESGGIVLRPLQLTLGGSEDDDL